MVGVTSVGALIERSVSFLKPCCLTLVLLAELAVAEVGVEEGSASLAASPQPHFEAVQQLLEADWGKPAAASLKTAPDLRAEVRRQACLWVKGSQCSPLLNLSNRTWKWNKQIDFNFKKSPLLNLTFLYNPRCSFDHRCLLPRIVQSDGQKLIR